MKLMILVLFLATICASASASTQMISFDCQTQDSIANDGKVRIQFELNQTQNGKLTYVDPEVEEIFRVTPNDSYAVALNENEIIRQNDKTVTFIGDSDGFFMVYLTLYRNSGFKSGYLKFKDKGEGMSGRLYSKVNCQVSK